MNTASSRPIQNPVLHRAEWLIPVTSPPVSNGAVLVQNGRILAAGSYPLPRKDIPAGTRIEDHGRAALFPALVNAHTHLELSAFKGAMAFSRAGFPDWIEAFFSLRAGMDPEAMAEGFLQGCREAVDSATGLCGDITNGGVLQQNHAKAPNRPERRIFLELLGFDLESVAAALPPGIDPSGNGADYVPVPHSVYSVSPEVISESKASAREVGLPFSVHTAEHIEEIEFLESGTGFCRELLEKLGRWNPGWRPPRRTPVEYLDSLGALDNLTILVHAVHMSDSDWSLAAERRCAVCFCPRSNRNIGVGMPNIEKALAVGISPSLGTDSLASGTDLNLFAEAAFVLDRYPCLRPEAVLEMITSNPARALRREADFGGIRPGLRASLLAISVESKRSQLAETLIHNGQQGAWKWVTPPAQN